MGLRKWSGAGMFGSLEALVAVPFLPASPWGLSALLVFATAAACSICGRAERILGVHDDPRIVLDEIVGMWAAVAFLPRTAAVIGLGFVLFRVLDSIKLPPYSWLARLPGGRGIVADDIGAAVVANVALRAALWRWPGLGWS